MLRRNTVCDTGLTTCLIAHRCCRADFTAKPKFFVSNHTQAPILFELELGIVVNGRFFEHGWIVVLADTSS